MEDSAPIGGDLDNLATLAALGVRTLLPTYNHANRAGSGCLDATDTGLTAWGAEIVAEMNVVGIVPDGSHCSTRTGLDLCDVSKGPVVYSHSCMKAIWEHPRNITDDQARACAATGGVVAITGVGIFLGPNTPTLDAMTSHLEYAVDLIGVDHVGISSDFSFDHADFNEELQRNPICSTRATPSGDPSSGCRRRRSWPWAGTSADGAGAMPTFTRCSAATSVESRSRLGSTRRRAGYQPIVVAMRWTTASRSCSGPIVRSSHPWRASPSRHHCRSSRSPKS